MTDSINTVILGASGYTGAELLRLLVAHPHFRITALTGESQAGKSMGEVYPHLRFEGLPTLIRAGEVDYRDVALVFCCLPHGTTQEIIAGIPSHVRIVDLSADFRLNSEAAYEEWYGHPHKAPGLQPSALYSITEFTRKALPRIRLVANPGCYPTASLLPLLPLVKAGLIDADTITIDALSGISGAGRAAKQEMLFTELDGGVSAYGIGRHRHMAEIEQELSLEAGRDVKVSFTPHLVPMARGMLATIHAEAPCKAADARAELQRFYAGEPFVKILDSGTPATQHVRGTNRCHIAVHDGRRPRELIIVSAIDNLVKGASGQAIQNANLMFGLPETTALELRAVFP